MGQLLIPLILFIGIFYFMLIRPQQKRTKETREMQASLKKGDKIVTIGGLHGTLESFDEKTVELRCNGSKLIFDRNAIRENLSADPKPAKAAKRTKNEPEAIENAETASKQEEK